jgi:hypothetical protein
MHGELINRDVIDRELRAGPTSLAFPALLHQWRGFYDIVQAIRNRSVPAGLALGC